MCFHCIKYEITVYQHCLLSIQVQNRMYMRSLNVYVLSNNDQIHIVCWFQFEFLKKQ